MNTTQTQALEALDTDAVLQRIERAQLVQKRNPPHSAEWRQASGQLRSLFDEMARRQREGVAHAVR